MRTHKMTDEALAQVQGFNPAQAVFFVMHARGATGQAVAAFISKDAAKKHARSYRTSACVKLGFVKDGMANIPEVTS
jgi:hypothetical protein